MTDLEKVKKLFSDNPFLTYQDMIDLDFSKSTTYEAHARVFPRKQKNGKRVLAISDLHCGHQAGLTPPEWWVSPYQEKLRKQQEESWNWYKGTVKNLGKIDVLFILGDCIDGKAKKNGGTELITPKLLEQSDMAKRCIQEINFDKAYFVYGTPFHVADSGEDYEKLIADYFKADIGDHIWVDINGVVFDLKHKIGGSSIPHGRLTALAKEYLWNVQWKNIDGAPGAQIFLRGHVHYHTSCAEENYLAMTLPALQSPNTKYGASQCMGTVNFGMVHFDIPTDATLDDVIWKKHIKHLKEVAPKLLVA